MPAQRVSGRSFESVDRRMEREREKADEKGLTADDNEGEQRVSTGDGEAKCTERSVESAGRRRRSSPL